MDANEPLTSTVQPQYRRKQGRFSRECLIFAAVSAILLIIIISLSIAYAVQKNKSVTVTSEICLTPHCVTTAARIISFMNQSHDPCDDFFEFACGNWIKNNAIPESKPSYSSFIQLRDDLAKEIKAIFEEGETEFDIESTRKARSFYQSCIDTDIIEKRKAQPLVTLLQNEFYDWPMLDEKQQTFTSDDIYSTLVKSLMFAQDTFCVIFAAADDRQSDVNVLTIDQGRLGLPNRKFFLEDVLKNRLEAYRTYMFEVAVILRDTMNSTVSDETLWRRVNETVEFEKELARIMIPEEQMRDSDKLYNRMSLKDFNANYSQEFNWTMLVNETIFNLTGIPIPEDEPIVVSVPKYFESLSYLLANSSKTTIVNYMVWQFLEGRIYQLDSRFENVIQKFEKVFFGTQSSSPRWQRCTTIINKKMGYALGRLYIQRKFDSTSKKDAEQMITNIRKAFKNILSNLTWMDGATMKIAQEKADEISEFIGYPDWMQNNISRLNAYYEKLNVNNESYFENYISEMKARAWFTYYDLRKKVDKTEWLTPPAVVNAYYNPHRNSITFPAGIFQPPFYSKDYPRSLNYGGVGAVIGHEISHGFDDQGRQFDGKGNLRDWWKAETAKEFNEKAQCIIEQYGNYVMPETGDKLNGVNTQGENIADNGGLKQAFLAYQNWVKNNKEELLLPGLNYTNNQLFMINYGQIWCSKWRNEGLTNTIKSGVHSPARYRVIGTLSNMIEFQDTFGCKQTDKMVTKKRCRVW